MTLGAVCPASASSPSTTPRPSGPRRYHPPQPCDTESRGGTASGNAIWWIGKFGRPRRLQSRPFTLVCNFISFANYAHRYPRTLSCTIFLYCTTPSTHPYFPAASFATPYICPRTFFVLSLGPILLHSFPLNDSTHPILYLVLAKCLCSAYQCTYIIITKLPTTIYSPRSITSVPFTCTHAQDRFPILLGGRITVNAGDWALVIIDYRSEACRCLGDGEDVRRLIKHI